MESTNPNSTSDSAANRTPNPTPDPDPDQVQGTSNSARYELPLLRSGLTALAERTAPPSAVDVTAARRSGERVKTRRTVGRTSAVLAVVTAVVLCVTILPSLLRPTANQGQIGGPATTSPVSNPWQMTPLAKGSDPEPLDAEFSWLPAGYTQPRPAEFAKSVAILEAWGPDVPLAGGIPAGSYSLNTDFTAWVARQSPDNAPGQFLSAPRTSTVDINGQTGTLQIGPSHFGSMTGPAGVQPPDSQPPDVTTQLGKLDWKTATGDYVELTASVPADFPDAAATMLHIARKLTVSDEPIRLPVYFRGLPAGLGAIDFSLPTDSPALPIVYSPGLSMGIGVSDEDEFDVLVTTVNSPDDADRPKDTVCKVENGLDICVYNVPASLAKIGAKGLLNDIVSLGTNPANWTTDVVR